MNDRNETMKKGMVRECIGNINFEVLNQDDKQALKEYSAMIMEVMEEFNKDEMSNFQIWFSSVEGIMFRRSGFGVENSIQFIAKSKGKIIGALEVENKNHIQNFFVKKEFHNKGIGRKLIQFSIRYFNNKGFKIKRYKVFWGFADFGEEF